MSHKGIMISAVASFVLLSGFVRAQDLTSDDEQPEAMPGPELDQVVPVADEAEAPIEAGTPAESAPVDDATALREQFLRYQQLLDDNILDEADNVAKRIVELAIRVHGPDSVEMARALTNLAIVQQRNLEYETARQNYEAAIDIIEDREDRLSQLLVNPLRGLGSAQLASGRPDEASQTFQRAVHITHVNDGPHNMGQLELLESLAETNLRMGLVSEAKTVHDAIYALNIRHFESDPLGMVPSLMRRASWQHRTGYIIDERATYRRIIRIIEANAGKNDLRLIRALTNLGRSYFYTDLSGVEQLNQPGSGSGEIYFKRALRIARESEQSNWEIVSDAMLALGDYYLMLGSTVRSRSQYKDAWELLSGDDEKLTKRAKTLGRAEALRWSDLPSYAGNASPADEADPDETLREGQITFSYDVSERGRVSNFRVIDASPPELYDIQRQVQREMRARLYRPRYEDGEAVRTENLTSTHVYYYRQSDLEAIRESRETASTEEDA